MAPSCFTMPRLSSSSGVVSDGRLWPKFHEFIYSLCGNPLVAPAMAMHWTLTQRVMGEVLAKDRTPRDIWDQHAAILDAISRGHITQAADFMVARLQGAGPAP